MMRSRPIAWAFVVALIAAACTGGDDRTPLLEEFSTFPPAPTTPPRTAVAPDTVPGTATTTTGAPTPITPAPVPSRAGRLVVIDESGDVVTLDPQGGDRVVVADAQANGAAFFQPLWGPGSELIAWGEASPAGFGLVTAEPDGAGRSVASLPSPPFYFFWAPDGEHLAALHNASNGIDLKVVDVGAGEATYAGTGTPFYISWHPDAGDLVAHIGTDRLTAIDTAGMMRDLGPTGAGYQSPQWIPDGIVHLAGDALQLLRDGGDTATLAVVPGPVSFVANPQGTRLALQSFGPSEPSLTIAFEDAPEVRGNVVVVIDLETGTTTTVAEDLALAFFWSPDGEKLLIFGPSDRPRHIDALVWNGAETNQVASFAPHGSFVRDVLPFFSQYAQSYQPWSPDSISFAFAGAVAQEQGVWVQSIEGGPAVRVGDGTWVSWSGEEIGSGAG